MDDTLPVCLQTMNSRSEAQLTEDVTRYAAEIEGMSYRAVIAHTGLGHARAERLHAWVARNGATPPTGGPADATPELADPEVQVHQTNPDEMRVEIKGQEGHPSAPEGQGIVRNLDELIAQADIDPLQWHADDFKVRTWSTPMRLRRAGTDGKREDEIAVVRNWYASATFRRQPFYTAAPPDWGKRIARRPRPRSGPMRTAVVVPDMHVGYAWSRCRRYLVPLHDWAAIDAVQQLIQTIQPDVIQHLGDGLDAAEFSERWAVPLELRATADPAARTLHAILRRQRETVPHAEIDWQDGNHDDRPERAHVGTPYDGLRPADDPDGPPLLSFARMVGLGALDITSRPYGHHRWLFDRILIHHGDKVKSRGGLTVAETVRDAEHSCIYGHIHRVEQASKTRHGPRGIRVVTHASPGTLGRLDGFVPGVSKRPDWQQGVAVVCFDEDAGQEHIELLSIHAGTLFWRGQRFVGDAARLAAEVAEQARYPQIALGSA